MTGERKPAPKAFYTYQKPRTPGDRVKKAPFARQQLLVALSADTLDDKGRPTKKLRVIIERLVSAAMAGEPWAIKEVIERVDGKALQTIAGDPDNPVNAGSLLGKLIVEYVGVDDPVRDDPIDITPQEKN